MIREGYIEKIVYKSDETGYCVMSVEGEEGEEIFVGTLPGAGEGLYVIAEGEYVNHPQYDIQFKFSSCEIQMPKDTLGIERYLGSGIIKGIGAVLAKKIVKKFKDDTLRIIEEEPERLAEISGISERKAQAIATSYMEKKEFQEVAIFSTYSTADRKRNSESCAIPMRFAISSAIRNPIPEISSANLYGLPRRIS